MGLLSSFATLTVLAVAVFVGYMLADPLKIGPLAGLDFAAEDALLAPWSASAHIVDPTDRLLKAQIKYQGEIVGPESIIFDSEGRGPYTGVSDGRVLRRSADDRGWETITAVAPNRDAKLCDYPPPPATARANSSLEPRCGRPMGIRFHPVSGDLFVADAYFGLYQVPKAPKHCTSPSDADAGAEVGGEEGSEAAPKAPCTPEEQRTGFSAPKLLTKSVDGVPFTFTNDLDIDADGELGTVYLTVTSSKYQLRHFPIPLLEGSKGGRLLKYELATGNTTALVTGIGFCNGVALSQDHSFLVFCETTLTRCLRYYIKGPKAGTHDVFIDLPGFPDNVRLNPRGRFWIAVPARRNFLTDTAMAFTKMRDFFLRIVPDMHLVMDVAIWPHGLIVEVDESGTVTDVLQDTKGTALTAISIVEEHGGQLWMGSLLAPKIGVIDYP